MNMNWLSVFLIIFEGALIQCMDEKGSEGTLKLPENFRDAIIAGESVSDHLKTCVMVFTPTKYDTVLIEGRELDEYDVYLNLGSLANIKRFFSTYDVPVTRAKIVYWNSSDESYNQYIKKFIELHGHELEQLIIESYDNEAVWDAFTKDGNYITFPNVQRFKYIGKNSRTDYKLKTVVPNARSVSLNGNFADSNCLEDMSEMRILELYTESIQEHQLSEIFLNNMKLLYVLLFRPRKVATMSLIANCLKELKTLELIFPEDSFLYEKINEEIIQLPSVTKLSIVFRYMKKLGGDLNFEMPNLKRLSLKALLDDSIFSDYQFIEFVEHFKELNRVDFYLRYVQADLMLDFPDQVKKNFEVTKWNYTAANWINPEYAHLQFDRLPSP